MRRLYQLLASGLVLLGVVHMVSTLGIFETISGPAVWFFSGGLAIVLTGALNLLNASYGRVAPGLRWTCVGANAIMLIFAVVTGTVTGASVGEFVIVFGLLGGVALLANVPAVQSGSPE